LPVVREFLNQLAVCGVRDDVSAGLIRSACGEGYPVAIVPDPALFFVDSVSGPPADVDKKQSHSGIRIGVNFAFHGPHSQGLTRARFLTYCDALKSVAAATQCQFVYFAHTAGERLLAQKLRESGLSAELAYGGPEELVRRYPTVDLHLGQMLHSCILAASTYTPIVNLVYDSKNLPFMQSLGLQDYCIFPDQVSTAVILKKITHALAEQVEIRQQLRRRVGELKHDRDRFLAGLAEVVRNSQTARTS
jgi:polysaccharide pyruvyl transferase WcaK-like protein